MALEPIDMFRFQRDWIQPKDKSWTKSQWFSFMKWTSFSMLCDIMFVEAMKATSKPQTYYKPPSYHGLSMDLLN
jgi:hypothetical protein